MLNLYRRPKVRFVTVGLIGLVPALNSLIGLAQTTIVHSFTLKKVDLTSSKGSLIIATALPRAFKPHQPATAISTNVGTQFRSDVNFPYRLKLAPDLNFVLELRCVRISYQECHPR